MRLVALLVLVPTLAVADIPQLPAGHKHVVIRKGEPAPADGAFSDAEVLQYDADRLRFLELELKTCIDLKPSEPVVPWWVLTAAGMLAGGLAVWKLK